VKSNTLLLAACVLGLPLAGCKSGSEVAMDAALGDVPVAFDAAQPDAAPDESAADMPGVDQAAGETSTEAGCSGWTTLQHLSPAELADLLATSNPIVINVHVPYAGDIPGTDTAIPYSNVDAIEAYLQYDRCADVVLVCLSGGMSQSAGNELIKRRYLRVRDLSGGMQGWQAAGHPLLKDGGV
jgi:rhodanese-related sulfurtransferase